MSRYIPMALPYARQAVELMPNRKRRRVARRFIDSMGSVSSRKAYARSVIRRAGRKYLNKKKTRRSRMQSSALGSGKATENIKQNQVRDVNLRTLDLAFLPNPAPATNPADFNVREKATCYYSGYKICRVFENRGTSFGSIFTVNYAIIQFNRGFISEYESGNEPTETATLEEVKKNFFRNNLDKTTRTENFQDASTGGSSLWDMTYDCRPMNPNKNYKIIFRKKFTLYPRAASGGERQRLNHSFKRIEMYLPVKKRMGFQDRFSNLCNTPFAEIWWTNSRSPADWPGTAQGNNVDVKTFRHHKLYYRG